MAPEEASARLEVGSWLSATSAELVADVARRTAAGDADDVDRWLHELVEDNRAIHQRDAVNLDPAANTMHPRAEALLSAGLGTRPSLGHPGAKYETGLEAIEQIEVIAAELAAEIFDAPFVELRVPSGAIANLYAFMAAARPGDAMIAPPATIAGHVTHHRPGAAGLYGLRVHDAPVDADRYSVDVDGLARLARDVRPAVISLGQSLNLFHHPVAQVRAVADEVGATVVFDAAHLSGPIAGGAWPNPLHDGAHVMTMSTYKSLGGPPAGLIATTDAGLAERIDAIAFPGLTANFDVAKSAALAVTLLDWRRHGRRDAAAMLATARALATALDDRGLRVYAAADGATRSHAFALDVARGDGCVQRLRRANLLTSAIGLPGRQDTGVRVGTSEVARWGATVDDMDDLAGLIAAALAGPPESVAARSSAWRRRFPAVPDAQGTTTTGPLA